MQSRIMDALPIADVLADVVEQISNACEEHYTAGEISHDEYERISRVLRCFTDSGHELISFHVKDDYDGTNGTPIKKGSC